MSDSFSKQPAPAVTGRGTALNTPNRFERIQIEPEFEQLDDEDQQQLEQRKVATEYFIDDSQSVVSQNNSPDLRFNFSINPYRGCAHGCSYCYARPYHEYLGLSAGLDFETKIFVKPNAPELFRKWLARKSWVCEPVNLSGITDPYQPAERKFEITRGCLEVAAACGQPLFLITKNAMVLRDQDILAKMAANNLVHVVISITSLDPGLIRIMEPRTSTPAARLRAIEQLAESGILVMVNVAPIIPGLNDEEVPAILRAVADAGATAASYVMLRLNGPVEPIFMDWVERHFPARRERIENGVRSMREGKLASSEFFDRMKGTGVLAATIRDSFKKFARHFGLAAKVEPLTTDLFERPSDNAAQKRLF
ncbi:MAG: PA0069 family radical SAM protein [Pirellulaceae bacterium]